MTTIEKNANKILKKLSTVKATKMGTVNIENKELEKSTGLSPGELNDAVTILENDGLVKLIQDLGTFPYIFHSVTLTPTGKNEVQKSKKVYGNEEHHVSHKKRNVSLLSLIAVAALILAIVAVPQINEVLFPPVTKIHVTDLNAEDGIIEGSKFLYSYEPRSLTINGTKNETFFLKVSNTGNADAHNFWIVMYSQPHGLWFDFQSSAIIDEGSTIPCQQKSPTCTIALVPKESSNKIVKYNIEFDHKLYQEIVDVEPKLFFNYGFAEGEEQTIVVGLKFN